MTGLSRILSVKDPWSWQKFRWRTFIHQIQVRKEYKIFSEARFLCQISAMLLRWTATEVHFSNKQTNTLNSYVQFNPFNPFNPYCMHKLCTILYVIMDKLCIHKRFVWTNKQTNKRSWRIVPCPLPEIRVKTERAWGLATGQGRHQESVTGWLRACMCLYPPTYRGNVWHVACYQAALGAPHASLCACGSDLRSEC